MIIYKITNLINNKIYIGRDKNNNTKYFGSGFLIKKAIKKYGKCNFKKEILEFCNNEKELNEKEIYWIKKLKSQNPKIGYNLCDGGHDGSNWSMHPNKIDILKKITDNHADVSGNKNSMYGKKHTEDSKKKMSINTKLAFENNPSLSKDHSELLKNKYKGRNNPNYNSCVILQYDLNMNFIKEWKDLYSLKEDGFNSKLISQCCRGRYKKSHGFIWKFKI